MRKFLDFMGKPAFNIWWGVSVENQATADERISILLQTPAAVRFLSVEPLLEHVDLRLLSRWPRPDWVIIGGESGPNARLCHVDWIRSIVNYCRAANVAPFVKQLGAFACIGSRWLTGPHVIGDLLALKHPKGGDPAEWPEDLRVREFPR
jgi:protein gp37